MKLGQYMRKQAGSLTLLDASSSQERELVIFAKLGSDGVAELDRLATEVEYMEQYTWLVDYTTTGGVKGQTRVRQYGQGDKAKYELTTKSYSGPGDALESNAEINREMFLAFKAMAPNGQIKTRYVLPIADTDLNWEVDVIVNAQGDTCPWVKIDLEIPEGIEAVPALPEGIFTQVIDKPRQERSQEEEAILNDLFENRFYIANPHAPVYLEERRVKERFAVIRDRLDAHIAVLKEQGVEDPTLVSLSNSLAWNAATSNNLREEPKDAISRRALVAVIRPYIDDLVQYIPMLSYDDAYFGEEEGQLKSRLKELEYMLARLSPPVVVVEDEDCDCKDET